MVFYGDTDVYFDTSNYRLSIVVSAACLTACPPACHAEGTELKRLHGSLASAGCKSGWSVLTRINYPALRCPVPGVLV